MLGKVRISAIRFVVSVFGKCYVYIDAQNLLRERVFYVNGKNLVATKPAAQLRA